MHLIHDLRIVLLVLARYLETLREKDPTETTTRDTAVLVRLVACGRAIADELLVSSDLTPPVVPVDVHDVLAANCDVIEAILGPQVKVVTQLAPGHNHVYARQVDLERILLNVVYNAAAAMPSGGLLIIETAHEPARTDGEDDGDAPFGRLRLTLADTGTGIEPREMWRVRDATQLPRPDGSGIGLSAVSLILQRLGGTLKIRGRDDAGTIVEIALPLTHAPAERLH